MKVMKGMGFFVVCMFCFGGKNQSISKLYIESFIQGVNHMVTTNDLEKQYSFEIEKSYLYNKVSKIRHY